MLKSNTKKKAIFLDRDGTITRHTDNFIVRPRQLFILPHVVEAIKIFNELGFMVVIITNQAVISRGLITPKEMENLHSNLIERLKRKKADIDGVYFCPHHPDGKIPPYNIKCNCRKPNPGLILKAISEFNIDPKKSFMIGDAIIDVLAGQNAKVKTIQVKTGPGHPRLDKMYGNIKPDFTSKNLKEAAKIVKKINKKEL